MDTIVVGDMAPSFSALNQDGKTVSLSDFSKEKVIMVIYVRDGSSGCAMDLQNIESDYTKIKNKGFHVLGLSSSSTESHKKFHDKLGLSFDLISDPDMKIINYFNLETRFINKTFSGMSDFIEEIIGFLRRKRNKFYKPK